MTENATPKPLESYVAWGRRNCIRQDEPWQIIRIGNEWRVELRAQEIVPDNPGEGTPGMVYGPQGTSGTFWCVHDTGEIDGWLEVPKSIREWLAAHADAYGEWHDFHFDRITVAERAQGQRP